MSVLKSSSLLDWTVKLKKIGYEIKTCLSCSQKRLKEPNINTIPKLWVQVNLSPSASVGLKQKQAIKRTNCVSVLNELLRNQFACQYLRPAHLAGVDPRAERGSH